MDFGELGKYAMDGVSGGALGMLMGASRRKAANAQRKSMDQAMMRLRELSEHQYKNRMNDLNTVMGFYQPVQNYLMGEFSAPTPQLMGPPPAGGRRPPGRP